MGQPALMIGSDDGNRLSHDPMLCCLILGQLELTLFEYVQRQRLNQSGVNEMREVKDFASVIKASVEGLKRSMAAAQGELVSEVQRGNVNAEKVRSMTRN